MSSARRSGLAAIARTGKGRSIRAIGAFVLALAAILALDAAVAEAHKGNPNYSSEFRRLTPATPGIRVEVLNYDDRLLLTNRTGKEVEVLGYDGEPYIRILADGTVQENRHSPAYYLNGDRFAEVDVPPQANAKAPPQWQTEDKTGRFEWHDHRIHWMSKALPTEVKDKKKETKIFDWRVPIRVGPKHAAITGTLYWKPDDSSAPVAAFVALGGFCVLVGIVVVAVRARRRRVTVREVDAW